jgi:hypothetical protein
MRPVFLSGNLRPEFPPGHALILVSRKMSFEIIDMACRSPGYPQN